MINLNILLLFLMFFNYISSKNIVLILVDDLDLTLDGMRPLKNAVDLIGKKGWTFENAFVASPICCPNRASILTGRYMHNHYVRNNSVEGNCNSVLWQNHLEKSTFANILKSRLNYTTFYAGKYMNKYGSKDVGGVSHVPPGWDWWYGLVGNSKYYNYSLSVNGTRKTYGSNNEDYFTDVISNFAKKFISKQIKKSPFLMVLAPPAPHAPFTPAKRHNNVYKNIIAKRTNSFNKLLNKQERHWLLRMEPIPLPDEVITLLDDVYRKRWETLLAVDELILNVYQALKSKNLLDETYIIFTSDNGYHIGQFGLTIDKRQPYETDIKVPLLIKGPDIKPRKIFSPVSSVDIFPTILDIAGLEYPSDGISILKKLSSNRCLLIEYNGEKSDKKKEDHCPSDNDSDLTLCSNYFACKCQDSKNNTYTCVRRVSEKFNDIFCQFMDNENFMELYNIKNDPDQLENIAKKVSKNFRKKYHQRLHKLLRCVNETCLL